MDANIVRAIINRKEDFLRRHLVLSTSVIDKLRNMDVIGEFTKTQMMANSSNSERQLTFLLTSLKSRGIAAFQGFLNVLRMTLHGWIADDILDSSIETGETSNRVGNNDSVRNIINRSYEKDISNYQLHYRPIFLDGSEYPVVPYVQVPISQTTQYHVTDLDARERTEHSRRHKSVNQTKYGDHEIGHSDISNRSRHGSVSPVTQIPENLRDLQRVFDNEASSTTKSLAVLRQEEITVRALLQQNHRQQQELLTKQAALQDIKDKMKQINKSATQLYKPQADEHETRARLKHLQKVPWSQGSD